MTSKLDQSLDQIMGEARKSKNRRSTRPGRGRGAAKAVTKTTGPAGGVKKNVKAPKATPTFVAPITAMPSGKGKIFVNNLPNDVDEKQIKEFFNTTGKVDNVLLSYGPNGKSRGHATVTFNKAEGAVEAAKKLNGIKIDNRPLKVEVIVAAKHVPEPAPQKGLADRVTNPKPAAKEKPKPATTKATASSKATTGAARGGRGGRGARGGRAGRAGRPGRPKPKTSEELDAEMQDYFGGAANADVAEVAMEDEIM